MYSAASVLYPDLDWIWNLDSIRSTDPDPDREFGSGQAKCVPTEQER
jgi:hypothetical protein